VPKKLIEVAGLASKPLSQWSDGDERKLVDAFLVKPKADPLAAFRSKSLNDTLTVLNSWSVPVWSGGVKGPILSRQRSFVPDFRGIPFP
jgi:hypothetical protein